MAIPTLEAEFEIGGAHESANEWEFEGSAEWESGNNGETEGEQFLGALRALASRAASAAGSGANWVMRPDSPQRALALMAARAAAQKGIPALGGLIGARLGSPAAGSAVAQPVANWLSSMIPAKEFEDEWESEVSPVRKIYPDALMEHLGHAAAMAESGAEAESLAGAMVPLLARTTPAAASVVMRAAPGLVCGVGGVVRALRVNPQTRPLIRTVPAIMRRTAASIANQTAQGRAVSPQAAVQTLARQTATVLASPQQAMRAFKRSQVLDRQFHRTAGIPVSSAANSGHRCTNCGGAR